MAAPMFLLVTVALSALTAWFMPQISEGYAKVLGAVTGFPPQTLLADGSLFFRPFFLVFIACIGALALGPIGPRIRLLGSGLGMCCLAIFVVDCALAWSSLFGGPRPLSALGGALSAVASIVANAWLVFHQFRLPESVRVSRRMRRRLRGRIGVAIPLVGAALLLWWGFREPGGWAGSLADLPLVGRTGPVPLIMVAAAVVLSITEVARIEWGRARRELPTRPIAFLIPAHNEETEIAACIASLDAAAANYSGRCTVYVVDNASSDDTARAARMALAACNALRGIVLECPKPGKAHALNWGLRHISEDILVRVDADTLVPPSLLRRLVPLFQDPEVGAVGGLPLPKQAASWLGSIRTVEVLYNIGFLRLAQGAVDGVMVVPGMLAAYRRRLVVRLGGFAQGMNGEDADMTIRIGRLGYRVITDTRIRAFTEMPQTLRHLREQRLRWTRGFFHVTARNMSTIWMRQGLRGFWFLPLSIFNGCRRAMALPALIYLGSLVLLAGESFELPRHVFAIGGGFLGVHMIIMIAVLAIYGELGKAPILPMYAAFNGFRLYISLETLLTLPLRTPDASRASLRRSSSSGLAGDAWFAGPTA
jgi:cellulose synthase/poly-beta-1,6-N-acetylglucosamine synthase-like glycosyltransferase